jgi:phosphoglycerol transferase
MSILVIVVVVGVLDQASPALMPNPGARARSWRADDAFVASLERQLPRNAMVFQLPVVDFPEHSAVERMSAHDLIKEGYLHSKSLRWSAGGVRGRDGEWQWPAAALPMRELVRGIAAMGFSALMLDRYGFDDNGAVQLRELRPLLGTPIAQSGDHLIAWDLRPAVASLLGDMSARARRELVQQLLDAPRLYLSSDADPIVSRGDRHDICADGTLTLVNPGTRAVRQQLEITLTQRRSAARRGHVTINARTVPISSGRRGNVIPVDLPPGTTTIKISVNTRGVRCQSVPVVSLPSVSAVLGPVPPG